VFVARQIPRGRHCPRGTALYADTRVANLPELAAGVRASWGPSHEHQRVCDDCRHAHNLDSRFGGVLRLCRRGELLFEEAAEAVHKLAARLGPAGAELVAS
jgi:hypothetical protein